MITSEQFSILTYKKPNLSIYTSGKRLSNVYGLDSEAYKSGTPFMICISDGTFIDPKNSISYLVSNYINCNFALYNMKYDSGAILYCLPYDTMHELWKNNEVVYNDIIISYIPHKFLQFKISKNESVRFWDFAQFYKMTLDSAAQKYLNKSKIDIETKTFSKRYVKNNFEKIKKYCIQDANLTLELANYLLDKLEEFGITASKVYSCASISFQYFCEQKAITTVWRYWKYHKQLLEYACDAYQGGKFEITARGSCYAYEYDIISAYPYEISNLVDISRARIRYSKTYENEAIYGFIRCRIKSVHDTALPCGIKLKDEVRIYPTGTLYLTITKNEYDYLLESGIEIKIYDGYWIFVERIKYPYKFTIASLFDIKDEYKNKDMMIYNLAKTIMNSKYGKMAQCIKDKDGNYVAGAGWNPIYASVITANTRIQVTKMQKLLKDKCLGVHTDSIITTEKVDNSLIPGEFGKFSYESEGKTILIGCGVYQLGELSGTKGIRLRKNYYRSPDTWQRVLKRSKDKEKIEYPVLHVESWYEAMSKNHKKQKINFFEKTKKIVDLNCDVKRTWLNTTNSKLLLSGLEYSVPKHVIQNKPKNW